MNKKIKGIVVFFIIAIMIIGTIQLTVYAADNTVPTVLPYQNGGEVVKSSNVGIYVDDDKGVAHIQYYWDYDAGNITQKVLSYDPPIIQSQINITTPETTGLHILMVRAQDASGNFSAWTRMPYYIVDKLTGTADTMCPVFDQSNAEELPRFGANVELNRTIKVKAVDQGEPSTGVFYVAYRWTTVRDTGNDPAYTVLYQNDTIVTNAPNTKGTWYLQIFTCDGSYNQSSITTYEYNIVDTTAPTLTLNGQANMDVELNGTFTDPGAIFRDNYDAEKTVYSTDTVDLTKVGTYALNYQAQDESGNKSNIVTRYVTVVGKEDTVEFTLPTKNTYLFAEPLDLTGASIKVTSKRGEESVIPIIESMIPDFTTNVVGSNSVPFIYNGKSVTYTYTVKDYIKNIELTVPLKTQYEYKDSVDLRGGSVKKVMASGATTIPEALNENNTTGYNTNVLGKQLITVNYAGMTKTYYITVSDTTLPVITLNGEDEVTVHLNSVYQDLGGTVSDIYDDENGIPVQLVMTKNEVDTSKLGTYIVEYTAVDSSGNVATKTRTVNVIDVEAPIITVDDTNNVYSMEVKAAKPTFKASAIDSYDGNIEVVITDDIDTNTVGKYTVTFKATDKSGNSKKETREFNVVDTGKPEIQIDDVNNKYTMYINGEKPEFNATVSDNYYSGTNIKLEITDNIDVAKVGKYTVTFKATDKSGNIKIETREFTVEDYIADIAVTAPNKTEYIYGEDLDLTGATVQKIMASGTVVEAETMTQAMVSGYDKNTVGTQEITVTYAGHTKTFNVIVNKKNPTLADITYEIKDVTYNSQEQGITVKAKEGIVGLGNIIVKYNGDTQVPTNANTYEVSVLIEEGLNYNALQEVVLGNYTINKEAQNVPGVSLDKSEVKMTDVAPVLTLTNAPMEEGQISYISSDENVATINAEGKITLVGAGEVIFTVTYGETLNYTAKQAQVSLSVLRDTLKVEDFEITNINQKYNGLAKEVTVNALVDGIGSKEVKYYQNDVEVQPVNAGEYEVRIEISEGVKYEAATLTVGTLTINKAVQNVPALSLDKQEVKMTEEAPKLSLTNAPMENANVVYASSDNKVAKIDKDGNITLVGAGKVRFIITYSETANYTAKSGAIELTVVRDRLAKEDFELTNNNTTYDASSKQVTVTELVDGIGKVTVKYYQNDEVIAAPTKAGSYEVRIEVAQGVRYEAATLTLGTLTINRAAAPEIIYPQATGITYGDKLAKSILTGGSVEFGSFAWTNPEEIPIVENAGYEVTFTPNANTKANYETITQTTKVVAVAVEPAMPTYTVPTSLAAVYGDTLASVTLPAGFRFQDELTTSVGNAGTNKFKVTYTPQDTSNYEVVKDIEVQIAVAKADQNIPAISLDKQEVKMTEVAPVLTLTNAPEENGTITYVSNKPEVATINEQGEITLVGAGEVTFTVTYGETANYTAKTANVTLTVKRDILLAENFELTNNEVTYDGTGKVVTVTSKVDGIGEVTVKYYQNDVEVENMPTNAGSYEVRIEVEQGVKYEAATLSLGTLTIAKKDPSKADLEYDLTSKQYTGVAQEVVVSVRNGLVGFGSISAANVKYYNQEGQEVGVPVAKGMYTVKVEIPEGDNYKAQVVNLGTYEITSKPVELSDLSYSLPKVVDYTGVAQTVEVLPALGVQGLGQITVKYNGSENLPVDAGTYNITVDITVGANYDSVTDLSLGTLTINKIAPVANNFKVTNNVQTYAKDVKEAVVEAQEGVEGLGEITVKYYKDGEEVEPTNVGEYVIKVTTTEGDNYLATSEEIQVGTLTINRAAAPEITYPQATGIEYGQKLGESSLTPSTIEFGSFAWTNPEEMPTVQNRGYEVTFTPNENTKANYETITQTTKVVAVEVAKAMPTYTLPTGLTAVYGETLANVTLPARFTFQDALETSVGNAGTNTFKVIYTPLDTSNYEVVPNIEVEIEVAKAMQNEPAVSLDKQQVKMTEPAPVLTLTNAPMEEGQISYTSSDENVATINAEGEITLVGAGEVTFTVTYGETANYTAKSASVTLTVERDTLLPENFELTNNEVTYDASGKVVTVTSKVDGIGEVTVKYYQNDVEVENMLTNAGSYEVRIEVEQGVKYEAATLSLGTLTIAKKDPSKADLEYDLTSKQYTGVAQEVVVSVRNGLVGFGSISAANVKYYNQAGEEVGVPVAKGMYTVKVEIPEGDNYKAQVVELGTYEITSKPVELIDLSYSLPKVVDYTASTVAVEVLPAVGVQGLGQITVKYNGIETAPVYAGTYNITVDITAGANYDSVAALSLGTLTINKIAPVANNFKVTNNVQTYAKDVKEAVVEAQEGVEGLGEITVKYYKDGEEVEPKNVGEYVIKVTTTEGDNYLATSEEIQVGTLTINRAAAPEITYPQASGITYGDKLAKSILTGGSVEFGSFAWTNPEEMPTVQNRGYEVTFTPNANTVGNYETITETTKVVAVEVAKAMPIYTLPTGLTAVYGQTLANVTLTERFSFQDALETSVGNAGTNKFKVTYTPQDTSNYEVVPNIEVEIAVAKAMQNEPAVSLDKQQVKMTEPAPVLTLKNAPMEEGQISYTSSDENVATINAEGEITLVGAGEVTFTVTYGETANYTAKSASVILTVERDTLLPENFELTNNEVTYDASGKVVTVTSKVDGIGKVTVKYYQNDVEVEGTPINAGSYEVRIEVGQGVKYQAATLSLGTLTINKKDPSEADLKYDLTSKQYTGEAQAVAVSVKEGINGFGSISAANVKYYNQEGQEVGVPVAKGMYTVKVEIPEGDNYKAQVVNLGTYEITSKPVELSDLSYSLPKVVDYTGVAQTVEVLPAVGVQGLGQITVKYNGSENLPVYAGTYNITVDITVGANYDSVTDLSLGTLTINKIAPVANNFKVTNNVQTYAKDVKAVAVEAQDGVVGLGKITVKYYKDSEEVKPKNVGEYVIKVTTTEGDNYLAASEEIQVGTLTINRAAAPEITYPQATGIEYGQKLGESSLTPNTIEFGSFAWTNPEEIPTVENAGYEVTFTPNANTKANYEPITQNTKVVAVDVAKGTHNMDNITFGNSVETYDGTIHMIAITGTLPGDVNVKYYYEGNETTGFTNAGIYTIEARFEVSENYNEIPSMSAVLTIKPAEGTLNSEYISSKAGISLADIVYHRDTTLADIQLPQNWSWVNPSTTPTVEVSKYLARYTSVNANYKNVEVELDLNVLEPADQTELNEYLDSIKYNELVETDYTNYAELKQLVDNAKAQTAQVRLDEILVQIKAFELEKAPIDKIEFNDYVRRVNALAPSDYENWDAFQAEIAKVEEQTLNSTFKAQFNKVKQFNLKIKTVNQFALKDIQIELAKLNKEDYTVQSWKAIEDLIAKAKAQKLQSKFDEIVASIDLNNLVEKQAIKIEITVLPKTSYSYGDDIDVQNGKIKITYDNNTSEEVAIEKAWVSGFDNTIVNTAQQVTIKYAEGITAIYYVTVQDIISGISIEEPNDTEYMYGEEINLTGLKVMLNTQSGVSTEVRDYEVTGYDKTDVGVQTITVKYGEYTKTFEVEVKDYVTGIKVTPPTENKYLVTDTALDLSGMKVEEVMASKDIGEDVTEQVTISTVDFSQPGVKEVTVTYDAKTAKFNIVVIDTNKPVIALNGEKEITIEVGQSYEEQGATAYADDGKIQVTIGGDTVNTNIVNDYVVTYNAVDSTGKIADEVTRTVHVVDTTAPVITINDNSNIYEMEVNGEKPNFTNANARDNYDGVVNLNISDNILVNKVGTYTITYTAVDANGNVATETRTFKVIDNEIPVIHIDEPTKTLEVKTTFDANSGVIVTDNSGETITAKVELNNFNINEVGTYTITYTAKDSSGNEAVKVNRTIIVKDNTAPVFESFNEGSVISIVKGTKYEEPGVVFTDNYDTNVTINTQGTVNYNEIGTYMITYTAVDKFGNTSDPVTRTVKVTDVPPVVYYYDEDNATVILNAEKVFRYMPIIKATRGEMTVKKDGVEIAYNGEKLQDGTYEVIVKGTDTLGNYDGTEITRNFIVDTTAPQITGIRSGRYNTVQTITFADVSDVAKATLTKVGTDTVINILDYIDQQNNQYTIPSVSGTYLLEVEDKYGNGIMPMTIILKLSSDE